MIEIRKSFGAGVGFYAAMAMVICGRPAAAQDTSSSHDIERFETYGNYDVFDEVDMLTDAVTHNLRCRESTIADETVLLFLFATVGTMLWP